MVEKLQIYCVYTDQKFTILLPSNKINIMYIQVSKSVFLN